jgi:transposase
VPSAACPELYRFRRNVLFAGLSQDTFPDQEKNLSNDNKQNEAIQRRQFSPEAKIKILRQHLVEKTPLSEVCEKHQITPTQFYQWQKTFLENGAAAFAKTASGRANSQAEQRLAALQNKLQRKDEVIAEIMAEHILLKKSLGES